MEDDEEYAQLTRERLLIEIERIEGFGEVLATAHRCILVPA